MKSFYTGLVAAPHTPMHADGSLNLGLIEQQVEHLAKHQITGAFVCGTTGEGLSLTLEERRQVAQRWVKTSPKSLPVLVHVGHNCLADAQNLAAHAQKIGASAISTLAPSFFRPASVSDLVDFCAAVALAAPELPFYFYNMPSMTGVSLSMVEFLKQASGRIPTLAGIKFTHNDLMEYQQCVRFDGGRFDILFGRDEVLLEALAVGARGAVGSTYNFAAPIYHRVMEACLNKDFRAAADQQALAVEMITVLNRYGGLVAGKAVMKMLGIDCGPVRLPLRNLSAEQYAAFHRELATLGIVP